MISNRLLIVSNRLPVTAHVQEGVTTLTPSSGGLARGLGPWHERSGGLWIGWPGEVSTSTSAQQAELASRLEDKGIVPVHLSGDSVNRYYHGFANRVLWPIFHYLIDRVPVDATGWDAYREVNGVFADVVAHHYRSGDTVWVHDYQLMLLPALLRQRLPHARIGFFLHIPFPSSEVFRVLPWRRQILAGLLGADLIGFHTFAYMRHFLASLLHIDGVEPDIDRVRLDDREVRMGVFPMGIDATHFGALAKQPAVIAEAEAIRRDAGGRRIVLGVDRLDYTKGIPRRLEAVERLLQRTPDLRDRIRYIQIAVPTRGETDSYQRFRCQVEEHVGRINGAHGTLRSVPVHYVHRAISTHELAALYSAADVMLVTPLRDGMNLVSKEFVASRVDEDGVLVLSEFAGASAELDGAVTVNPYDVGAVSDGIDRALSMTRGERGARMKALRHRVHEYDVHAWAREFLARLEAARPSCAPNVTRPRPALVRALLEAQRAPSLRLLLDYDGTLVPYARAPELAAPDDTVFTLLTSLAALPRTRVEIVSGRPREALERWFGELPISLWAEHGFWHRSAPGEPWRPAMEVASDWMERIVSILEQFTASTPGSTIERKSATVAWHYRGAQREFGARQAHELRMLLGDALSNQPLEVLEGVKVIEVRLRGVSKATVASPSRSQSLADEAVIAFGDDRTDEELFRALPPCSVTVAVGRQPTSAHYYLDDYRAARQVLRSLVANADALQVAPSA